MGTFLPGKGFLFEEKKNCATFAFLRLAVGGQLNRTKLNGTAKKERRIDSNHVCYKRTKMQKVRISIGNTMQRLSAVQTRFSLSTG